MRLLITLGVLGFAAACAAEGSNADLDAGSPSNGDAALNAPDAAMIVDASASCADAGEQASVGISSVSLERSPLQLGGRIELSGPGLDAVVASKMDGLSALISQHGRSLLIVTGGFWDIDPGRSAEWIETANMVHGAVFGDVDADGDQDLMLLSSGVEDVGSGDAAVSNFVTRVLVWERTPSGLTERAELFEKIPGGIVGMPFAFGDVDDDGDLDVLTFEQGAPIGYVHDGAFGFDRSVLGEIDSAFAERAAIAIALEDRDRDGVDDMLVVLGGAAAFENLVLAGDGAGGFLPHGPASEYETTAIGLALGDVTGDGLSDVVSQRVEDDVPLLRLTASVDSMTFAPTVAIEPGGLGADLVDVDGDTTLDIVTRIGESLFALVALGDGSFEPRDLGIQADGVLDYAAELGTSDGPARLHVLDELTCTAAQ